MLTVLFRSFRDGVGLDYRDEVWRRYLLLTLLKYFLWACALALLGFNLWSAWPYYITGLPATFDPLGMVGFFYVLINPMTIGNVFTISWVSALRSPTLTRVYAAALCGALAAGDDAVTPIADDVKHDAATTVTSGEQAPETETFAPLAHPVRSMANVAFAYLGLLGGLSLFALCGWVAATLSPFDNSPADVVQRLWWPVALMTPIIIAICGVLVLGLALLALRSEWNMRRGLVAVADLEGMTVRVAGSSRGAQHLRWAEARGFARLRYVDGTAYTHTLYLLTTESGDLLWDEPPPIRYLSPVAAARADALRGAARRLAQVVAQRTGLPLRDISATMRAPQTSANVPAQPFTTVFEYALRIARGRGDEDLATHIWMGTHPGAGLPPRNAVSRMRGVWLYQSTTRAQRDDIVRYALALLPYYPTPEQTFEARERQRGRMMRRLWKWDSVFTVVLLLVGFLLLGGSYGLRHWYAPSALRSLSAQVQAQRPIYLTSFGATPYIDWPTRTPAGGDTRSARFTSSGYELATQDPQQAEGAWSSFATSGENAFELTLRLTSAHPSESSAAGGLLLDVSPDGSSALAFTISTFGSAQVARCHNLNTPQGVCEPALMTYVDWSQDAQSVSLDPGATNTLLVIRHGLMYIYYVNDVPVIVYRDPSGVAGVDGRVGVYLDAGANAARFTRLAVYPLPDTTPFWAR